MVSRHLVDRELLRTLDEFPPLLLAPETLAAVRAKHDVQRTPPLLLGEQSGILVENLIVPGSADAPDVSILLYRPSAAEPSMSALLHMHAGGFVLGSPIDMHQHNCWMARSLGCIVASVDYRLAPETRFPGALEDCYAALTWLHHSAERLGIDRKRIGVKGESAGGGLAAGLSLLARDRNGPAIAFQHLTYPMLDDRTCVRSEPNLHVGEFVWTAEDNVFGWTALLGREPGGDDVSPYAAPARATDVAGLPPTYISVGALDLFLEEDIAYATRLARAGVPVELHVYPGAFHGFQLATGAAVTRASNRDGADALRRSLATSAMVGRLGPQADER